MQGNPLNIRCSSDNFIGELNTRPGDGFKQFVEVKYGFRAAFVILNTYRNRHNIKTIRQVIERWAPNNENDTEAYIKFVEKRTGFRADTTINLDNEFLMINLVAAMAMFENGCNWTSEQLKEGYKLRTTRPLQNSH